MGAMSDIFAAGFVDVAKERCDNIHLPVATDSQDPLEVNDGRRHCDLMSNDDFAYNVELVVGGEFDNLCNHTIAVRLAEGRVG